MSFLDTMEEYDSDESSENNDENNDKTEEKEFFDERKDGYEEEWRLQSLRRFVDHVCNYADIDQNGDVGCSEWADLHDAYTDRIYNGEDSLKESNKEQYGYNHHKYKQQFGEPDYDFQKLTADNVAEKIPFDLSEEMADDYDPLFIPVDFEPPEEFYYRPNVEVSGEAIHDTIEDNAEDAGGIATTTKENLMETLVGIEKFQTQMVAVDEMVEIIEESDEYDMDSIIESASEKLNN